MPEHICEDCGADPDAPPPPTVEDVKRRFEQILRKHGFGPMAVYIANGIFSYFAFMPSRALRWLLTKLHVPRLAQYVRWFGIQVFYFNHCSICHNAMAKKALTVSNKASVHVPCDRCLSIGLWTPKV